MRPTYQEVKIILYIMQFKSIDALTDVPTDAPRDVLTDTQTVATIGTPRDALTDALTDALSDVPTETLTDARRHPTEALRDDLTDNGSKPFN